METTATFVKAAQAGPVRNPNSGWTASPGATPAQEALRILRVYFRDESIAKTPKAVRESAFMFAQRLAALFAANEVHMVVDGDPDESEINIVVDKRRAEKRVSIVFRDGTAPYAWYLDDAGTSRKTLDMKFDAERILRWLTV